MLQILRGGPLGRPVQSLRAFLGDTAPTATFKPAIPGGSLLIQQGPQVATAPDVAGKTPTDVCTSDKLASYINGAWRLGAQTSCGGGVSTTIDSLYLKSNKIPVFVGPFQITPTNVDGQITTLDTPSLIGPLWGSWVAGVLGARATNMQAHPKYDDSHELLSPAVVQKWPMRSFLPRVVGTTVDYEDDGTPTGKIVDQIVDATASRHSAAVVYMAAPAFPPVPAEVASGGHALHPSKAWFGNDAAGNRMTLVMYDGDPNTYGYYSLAQWIRTLSPAMLTDGSAWLLGFDYLKPSDTIEWNRNQDLPPIARFYWPSSWRYGTALAQIPDYEKLQFGIGAAESWGMWLSVAPAGERLSSSVPSPGDWDTGLDAPEGYVMQVGLGPIPHGGIWDAILDTFEEIIRDIGEGLFDVASWLSTVLCNVSKAQASLSAIKDPSTRAAAWLAFQAASMGCPTPPVLNCTITPTAPGCTVPVAAVKPWYTQWYVIAGGLAVVGILAIQAMSPAKPASAT